VPEFSSEDDEDSVIKEKTRPPNKRKAKCGRSLFRNMLREFSKKANLISEKFK